MENLHSALDGQSPRSALEQGTPAQRDQSGDGTGALTASFQKFRDLHQPILELVPGQTFHLLQLTRAGEIIVQTGQRLFARMAEAPLFGALGRVA